jgi:hypothetical protein
MKLLSLGSNQKPSGCLDLAVITAERATNCATEDVGANTLLDERIEKLRDNIPCTKCAVRIPCAWRSSHLGRQAKKLRSTQHK